MHSSVCHVFIFFSPPPPSSPHHNLLIHKLPTQSQGCKPDLLLDSPVSASPPPSVRERSFTSPARPSTPHSPLVRSSQEDKKRSSTVRVKKVESVILQTDRQSYPQIVLYVGGDKQKVKEEEEERLKGRVLHLGSAENRPEEPFSTDHLVESDKCIIAQVTRASERNDVPKGNQTPPDSGSVVDQIEGCVIETSVESANPTPDLDHNTLQNSRESLLYSPTDSRECESATPSSEVSTVIPRDQSSSRCSGSLTGSEDLGGRSEFSETESQYNSPHSRRRLPSQITLTQENPFCPLSVAHSDTQEGPVSISSQFSLPQLSNPPGVIAVDQVGLLPLEFRSELFGSSSQETESVVYYSPRDGDTTFHFSLTSSLPEDFGEFSPRVVKRYSAEFSSVTEHSAPVLAQISEEPEPESRQSDSSPRKTLKHEDASTDTTGLQLEGALDSSTVSERSSVVSTDSSSSSAIVVSYLQKNVQSGEQISDIVHIATGVSYTNSFSSSSEDGFENPTDQLPRKKSKQSDPELQNTANSTEETNDSSEMAVRTQVLRIYPSQSSSGVPHHSLNTSGPDSPSLHNTSKGRTLYVMPSSGHSKYTAVVKPQKSSVPEYEEVDIPIVLLPGEKRLGFSVAGGKEQGTFPQVGSIGGGMSRACSSSMLKFLVLCLHITSTHWL